MALKDTDMEFFERKYAMYILLAIKNNPGKMKHEIVALAKGNERTKYLRITEFLKEGYLEYKTEPEKAGGKLFLTKKGNVIADKIVKLRFHHLRTKDLNANLEGIENKD